MTHVYPNRASLLFSACLIVAVMSLPWPDAKGPSLAKSTWLTFHDVNVAAAHAARRFGRFEADINTPSSGEVVLPVVVQEALSLLRGRRGAAVKKYDLSPSLKVDPWEFQQTVVATWPRKLEANATARLVRNTDQPGPGCTLIDRRAHVSLVYCP